MRRRGEMEDGKEGRTDKGRGGGGGGGREGRRETKKGRDIDMIRIHVILVKIVVTSKFLEREEREWWRKGGGEKSSVVWYEYECEWKCIYVLELK